MRDNADFMQFSFEVQKLKISFASKRLRHASIENEMKKSKNLLCKAQNIW